MIVEPPHGRLDDGVQRLERDRGRDLDLAPDQPVAAPKLDGTVAISLKLSAQTTAFYTKSDI